MQVIRVFWDDADRGGLEAVFLARLCDCWTSRSTSASDGLVSMADRADSVSGVRAWCVQVSSTSIPGDGSGEGESRSLPGCLPVLVVDSKGPAPLAGVVKVFVASAHRGGVEREGDRGTAGVGDVGVPVEVTGQVECLAGAGSVQQDLVVHAEAAVRLQHDDPFALPAQQEHRFRLCRRPEGELVGDAREAVLVQAGGR